MTSPRLIPRIMRRLAIARARLAGVPHLSETGPAADLAARGRAPRAHAITNDESFKGAAPKISGRTSP
eukprot:2146900-Pyramimonas_sp.AAC.1